MKKRHVSGILAAVICAAVLAYVFLWPHSLYDIAWLGVGRGEAETVRIQERVAGEDPLTIDVTLPIADSFAFLDVMRDASAHFLLPGRQTVFHGYSYWVMLGNQQVRSEVAISEQGRISQQSPGGRRWGEGTFRIAKKDQERIWSLCEAWTDPNGKYPGLAFLREFFAIGKNGRSDVVRLNAPDGVYGVDAIETLHSGIKPYMTERGFENVLLGRSLYDLEYLCKQKGENWLCGCIEVSPASEPGYFFYRIGLVEETSGHPWNYWFTGNYSVSEDGLVDEFYIDLKGAAWVAE